MLLYLNLLELHEARTPGLQIQSAARLVDATVIRDACAQRHEGHGVHRLVGLRATLVTRVRRHRHHGLHLRATGHDS